ncbi:hypothetical protein SAMN04488059_11569 [Devosia psychrophila]|uniref:Uncharacterized protein n=1 Tax=Devosia psychrophila TaxID=728005 RepID=A0A1I1NBW9_9HYPH|nr:hypothetical protein SAMN04488059_11569 [Devosia psychrophila]
MPPMPILGRSMFALNATSGKPIMPKPTDVLDESIKMWSDGTMLRLWANPSR